MSFEKPEAFLDRALSVKPSDRARLQRLEVNTPYLRANSNVASKSIYAPVNKAILTSSNQLDLRTSQYLAVGSVPPFNIQGNFAATATTTSITWYWDGTNSSVRLAILRGDGSKFPVPAGSITISGLSSNTTYGFLPFWPTNGQCSIGWVPGTVGSDPNKIAFTSLTDATAIAALQQQGRIDREPLTSAFMTFATPAAGTSGGAGGGGGTPGSCVIGGTDIEVIHDSDYSVEVLPQDKWIHAEAGVFSLNATPDHPVYRDNGNLRAIVNRYAEKDFTEGLLEPFKVRMDELHKGDLVLVNNGLIPVQLVNPFTRACTKRKVHLKHGHLFKANGWWSHNYKQYNPP